MRLSAYKCRVTSVCECFLANSAKLEHSLESTIAKDHPTVAHPTLTRKFREILLLEKETEKKVKDSGDHAAEILRCGDGQ